MPRGNMHQSENNATVNDGGAPPRAQFKIWNAGQLGIGKPTLDPSLELSITYKFSVSLNHKRMIKHGAHSVRRRLNKQARWLDRYGQS